MKHRTIAIDNVDVKQLDTQRKLLGDLSYRADRLFLHGPPREDATVTITREQAEALSGVVNMLDDWSDQAAAQRKRYLS